MGQNFYHGMLMLLHDSMPSFMNFRQVLDLLELQKQVPQHLPESHGAVVFKIHPHFLHRTLIRLRRIYNFLLFHANIIRLSHTFSNFLYDLLD